MSASSAYQNAENAWTLGGTYAVTAQEDAAIEGAVRTRFRTSIATIETQKQQLQQRAAALTPADLFSAHRVRREYSEAWAKVFADSSIVACLWPQKVQTPPPRANDSTGGFSGVESSRPNTTGWPCLNLPVGRDADTGIPVGIDMAAPYGGDAVILQLAIDYQERHPYHLDIPADL